MRDFGGCHTLGGLSGMVGGVWVWIGGFGVALPAGWQGRLSAHFSQSRSSSRCLKPAVRSSNGPRCSRHLGHYLLNRIWRRSGRIGRVKRSLRAPPLPLGSERHVAQRRCLVGSQPWPMYFRQGALILVLPAARQATPLHANRREPEGCNHCYLQCARKGLE